MQLSLTDRAQHQTTVLSVKHAHVQNNCYVKFRVTALQTM